MIVLALLVILLIIAITLIPITIATFCISGNIQPSFVSCSSQDDCIDVLFENGEGDIENLPEPIQSKASMILDKAVYCESVCKMKKLQLVSSIGGQEIEGLEKVEICNGEQVKIRLTLIQIAKAMKVMGESA